MTIASPAATLTPVAMLSEPLPLHDIADTEAFCRAVVSKHLAFGVRTTNGLSGPSELSPDDRDELVQYLMVIACRYADRYHGKDDGRGKLCFSGFVIGILHKRVVDWKRKRWRSTRYLTEPIVEMSYDDELGYAVYHDVEGPVGVRIDPSKFYGQVEHAYRKVCKPLAESGYDSSAKTAAADLKRFAARTSQPLSWVNHALRIVKAELEQQDIRPCSDGRPVGWKKQPIGAPEMEQVA